MAVEISSLKALLPTNPEIGRKKPSQKNVLASLIEPHQVLKSIRPSSLVKTFINGFDVHKSLGPLKRFCLLRGQGKALKGKKYREEYTRKKESISGKNVKYSNILRSAIFNLIL